MPKEKNIYSFSSIYTQYYQKSYGLVKSYVHDDMVSEDIVSDSLVSLWQYMKQNEVQSVDRFLLTTLKNKALDYLRHEAKSIEIQTNMADYYQNELLFRISTLEECDPKILYSKEILKIYRQTLDELPEMTKKVFIMSRKQHMSNKEIADELGVTVKTVEYHITKTIKILRVELKDYLPFLMFFFN